VLYKTKFFVVIYVHYPSRDVPVVCSRFCFKSLAVIRTVPKLANQSIVDLESQFIDFIKDCIIFDSIQDVTQFHLG
jgi:hypothetical protein